MKTAVDNQILSDQDIAQKIKRMAYEIYEANFDEKEIILAGIADNGIILAQLLSNELHQISPFIVHIIEIHLDKKKPTQSDIKLSVESNFLLNKTVILVDDVQNTGRTLAYSLKPFLDVRIKKLQTAVLIDRDHKNFPISADFIGYALSTTLKEHITVVLNNNNKSVYLD